MKTLFRLVVVVVLVLAVAAFLLRDSAYWTPLEIQRGIEARDPARVEKVVSFERFSASAASAMGAVAADQMGVAGDDAGSRLLGGLVQIGAEVIGHGLARESAQEMRKAIASGTLERRIGPFEVNEGWQAFGDVHTTSEGATVELKGTCEGTDAALVLVLERQDGPFAGYPHRYVVVGVDPDSGKRLVRQCNTTTPTKPSAKTPAKKPSTTP